MDAPTTFLVSALFFVVCNIVISILIMHELEKRNIKTNVLFMRFLIIRYVHQYREATVKERGHPGPLFYYWIISINMAAVTAIIGLILKRYV
jgi:hypothetical protein